MNRSQLPGRAEALREVFRVGASNASPELRHLAGMGIQHSPRPRETNIPTITFTGGEDGLTPKERAALPF